MSKKMIIWFVILSSNILSVIMFSDLNADSISKAGGDAINYIEMSKHTFASVGNPFALRVFSPLLVKTFSSITDISLNTTWLLLTFAATCIALYLFFSILYYKLKISFFISVIFTLLLCYTYNFTLFNYIDYWLVDPLNNMLLMASVYFLIENKFWYFMFAIIIGFVNKEVMILFLPLWAIKALVGYSVSVLERKKLLVQVLVSVGVLLLYLIYRKAVAHLIGPEVHYSAFNGTGDRNFIETVRFSLSSAKDQFYIYSVFDYFWILFLFSLYLIFRKSGPRNWLFVSSIYMMSILMVARFFATDVERVFIMLAPFVFILSAMLFRNIDTATNRKWLGVFLFIYIASNLGWLSRDYFILSNILVLIIFFQLVKGVEEKFPSKDLLFSF